MNKVSIDDLGKAIVDELKDWSQDVAEGVKTDCKTVAKECVKEIKRNAPRRTGEYKKGWRSKVVFENANDVRIVIHNKDHYQLTHLLENGHANVNGGRTRAYPHIAPAEENAAEKLMKKVKVTVKG